MKVIEVYCDNVEHLDEQVPATEVVISIDGRKPVAVDLCEVCRKQFVGPVEALLRHEGQPVKQSPKRGPGRPPAGNVATRAQKLPGDARCPVPGCGWSGTRTALNQHAPTKHDQLASQLEGTHGRLMPDGRHVQLEHRCEECPAAYDTTNALAVHVRKTHP